MQLTYLIFLCCLFPFLMTVLGAAAVFLCPRGTQKTDGQTDGYQSARQIFLGFAGGVMLAASVWSLLTPAIEGARALGLIGWLPAAVGIVLGVLFLLGADRLVTRLRVLPQNGRSARHGSFLLQLAMTVHNIPEGMAVGLSVALAADAIRASGGIPGGVWYGGDHAQLSAALALSLGIGIQNLPEGAAVSLPLRQDGMSSGRAFLRGCLSGIVEPVFGIATALFLGTAASVMPWLLSFAAGAMLYVVVCELIPAANAPSAHGGDCCIGTLSTVAGFLVMMVLDVALG